MHELFTEAFARALRIALEDSAAYRHAGRRWEGALVLVTRADATAAARDDAALFLDLAHGHCRDARLARPGDDARARFVIAGSPGVWRDVMAGAMAPVMAIMRGRLTLEKGSLAALLPHVAAATALVDVARSVQERGLGNESAHEGVTPDANDRGAVGRLTRAAEEGNRHGRFQSTSPTGLRFDTVPMRLWEKAKRFGIWNPADIDFSRDRADWDVLSDGERDLLLRLAALFQSGEEAVVIDILPLIDVIAQEGRLEEQLYLTSFVWEEAKHVEGMRRFLDAVGATGDDLSRYRTPSYERIFAEALPDAMNALRTDRSPAAQARASATYNMIVEGVLAETGYHVFHRILTDRGIMPGMQEMAGFLKQDESRHIAYGLHLLSRLTSEHGDAVWPVITGTMDTLLAPAVAVIGEAFAAYPEDAVPFGLTPEPFVDFAMRQFSKRIDWLERARATGMIASDELV